jgi:hypothetical protein
VAGNFTVVKLTQLLKRYVLGPKPLGLYTLPDKSTSTRSEQSSKHLSEILYKVAGAVIEVILVFAKAYLPKVLILLSCAKVIEVKEVQSLKVCS